MMLRTLLLALGLATIAAGLLFFGQGLGIIRWPQTSFMIDRTIWTFWGTLIAFGGGLMVFIARRRP